MVDILRCPACYGALALEQASATGLHGRFVHEGHLRCQSCRLVYPIHLGVAGLAVLDQDWAPCLKETIARRAIFQETLEGTALQEQEKVHEETGAAYCDEVQRLTQQVYDSLGDVRGLRILDLGAGLGETSRTFAEKGAQVVALEPEAANLFEMQMAGYEGLVKQEAQKTASGAFLYNLTKPVAKAPFVRIMGGGHRIPIQSNVFDVVFCRSVLHHLDDMTAVLREMLRVAKPNGQLILASEPIRSIFDSPSTQLLFDVEAQKGLNESRPHLHAYLLPLLGKIRDLRIQYFPYPLMDRTKKVMDRLHYDYSRHLHAGEWLRGWKILKLLPACASTQWWARKRHKNLPVPLRANPLHHNQPLLEIFRLLSTARPFQERISNWQADSETLASMRRALMRGGQNGKAQLPPSLDLSRRNRHHLNYGFSEPMHRNGEAFRPTLQRAGASLMKQPGHSRLHIHFVPVRPGLDYHIRISVNAQFLHETALSSPTQIKLEVQDLPAGPVDITIENTRLHIEPIAHVRMEFGVGVSRLYFT